MYVAGDTVQEESSNSSSAPVLYPLLFVFVLTWPGWWRAPAGINWTAASRHLQTAVGSRRWASYWCLIHLQQHGHTAAEGLAGSAGMIDMWLEVFEMMIT